MERKLNLSFWVLAEDIVKLIIDLPYYIYIFISAFVGALVSKVFPKPEKSLNGEIILVTGAASGLGQGIVLQIAKKYNSTLVLWDINKAQLQKTSEECIKLGAKVYFYVVDLTKQQDVISTAKRVRREVGCVTVLYNNAGLACPSLFQEANAAMEEKVIQVNLMSYLWTIREFLPGMIERGSGHLVSTCSGIAFVRSQYLTSYAASKHGLRGFIESLKLEMRMHPGKPDIKISTVYPGWINTPMAAGASWKPRYRSEFFGLTHMDRDFVAEKVLDGIVNENENIFVPEFLKFIGFILGILPTKFIDSMENHLFRELCIIDTSINPTAKTATSANGHEKENFNKVNRGLVWSD